MLKPNTKVLAAAAIMLIVLAGVAILAYEPAQTVLLRIATTTSLNDTGCWMR